MNVLHSLVQVVSNIHEFSTKSSLNTLKWSVLVLVDNSNPYLLVFWINILVLLSGKQYYLAQALGNIASPRAGRECQSKKTAR